MKKISVFVVFIVFTFVYSIIHIFTNGVGTNNIMPIPLYFLGINIITLF